MVWGCPGGEGESNQDWKNNWRASSAKIALPDTEVAKDMTVTGIRPGPSEEKRRTIL